VDPKANLAGVQSPQLKSKPEKLTFHRSQAFADLLDYAVGKTGPDLCGTLVLPCVKPNGNAPFPGSLDKRDRRVS
jgi:hypothetical protein